jgi:hypothetical protein
VVTACCPKTRSARRYAAGCRTPRRLGSSSTRRRRRRGARAGRRAPPARGDAPARRARRWWGCRRGTTHLTQAFVTQQGLAPPRPLACRRRKRRARVRAAPGRAARAPARAHARAHGFSLWPCRAPCAGGELPRKRFPWAAHAVRRTRTRTRVPACAIARRADRVHLHARARARRGAARWRPLPRVTLTAGSALLHRLRTYTRTLRLLLQHERRRPPPAASRAARCAPRLPPARCPAARWCSVLARRGRITCATGAGAAALCSAATHAVSRVAASARA